MYNPFNFNYPHWANIPGKRSATIRVTSADILTYGWTEKKGGVPYVKFTGFEFDEGNTRTSMTWLQEAVRLMANHVGNKIGVKPSHTGKVNEKQIRYWEDTIDGQKYEYTSVPVYLNATDDKQKRIVFKVWATGAGRFSHCVEVPPMSWDMSKRGNMAAFCQFGYACGYVGNLLQKERPGGNKAG